MPLRSFNSDLSFEPRQDRLSAVGTEPPESDKMKESRLTEIRAINVIIGLLPSFFYDVIRKLVLNSSFGRQFTFQHFSYFRERGPQTLVEIISGEMLR